MNDFQKFRFYNLALDFIFRIETLVLLLALMMGFSYRFLGDVLSNKDLKRVFSE